jgi:hypothetical protein
MPTIKQIFGLIIIAVCAGFIGGVLGLAVLIGLEMMKVL